MKFLSFLLAQLLPDLAPEQVFATLLVILLVLRIAIDQIKALVRSHTVKLFRLPVQRPCLAN
ncbi:MAG: hypothetical protein JKY70_14130 [Mucilaginibacter sp.]|nr:hypothetical protein [Mucilaginibacter sp.]